MIAEVITKAQINAIEAQLFHLLSYDVYVNFDQSATNFGASGIRGVGIYVKDGHYVKEVKLNTDFKDPLWVEIHLSRNDSILCGCVYRSPTKEKDASLETTNQVCDIPAKASQRNGAYLLICGDFNYREIDCGKRIIK